MNLCKYKNLLGVPNKGIHSYRFMGVAIADVIMTIICAILISFFLKKSLVYTCITLFILGIILHRLFCVRTTIDKLLFPNAE
jgi:Na+/melibiose symporter-like transporter